jgi:outer membrane protein W
VGTSGGGRFDLDTNMIPINVGFRYYFDVRNAPKAISVANPYVIGGGGYYMRTQNVVFQSAGLGVQNGTTNSFGAFGGAGVEFQIYKRHVYLGIDMRFHFVFFPDGDQTYNNIVPAGSRSGNYFTPSLSLTYSF